MPFQDCICFRLGKAARKVTKAYREEIASYGLTHGQFFLIIAVMEEDGLLPSELADKTCQDRPTITGLLDHLEKDGWIEKETGPKRPSFFADLFGLPCKEMESANIETFRRNKSKVS